MTFDKKNTSYLFLVGDSSSFCGLSAGIMELHSLKKKVNLKLDQCDL